MFASASARIRIADLTAELLEANRVIGQMAEQAAEAGEYTAALQRECDHLAGLLERYVALVEPTIVWPVTDRAAETRRLSLTCCAHGRALHDGWGCRYMDCRCEVSVVRIGATVAKAVAS